MRLFFNFSLCFLLCFALSTYSHGQNSPSESTSNPRFKAILINDQEINPSIKPADYSELKLNIGTPDVFFSFDKKSDFPDEFYCNAMGYHYFPNRTEQVNYDPLQIFQCDQTVCKMKMQFMFFQGMQGVETLGDFNNMRLDIFFACWWLEKGQDVSISVFWHVKLYFDVLKEAQKKPLHNPQLLEDWRKNSILGKDIKNEVLKLRVLQVVKEAEPQPKIQGHLVKYITDTQEYVIVPVYYTAPKEEQVKKDALQSDFKAGPLDELQNDQSIDTENDKINPDGDTKIFNWYKQKNPKWMYEKNAHKTLLNEQLVNFRKNIGVRRDQFNNKLVASWQDKDVSKLERRNRRNNQDDEIKEIKSKCNSLPLDQTRKNPLCGFFEEDDLEIEEKIFDESEIKNSEFDHLQETVTYSMNYYDYDPYKRCYKKDWGDSKDDHNYEDNDLCREDELLTSSATDSKSTETDEDSKTNVETDPKRTETSEDSKTNVDADSLSTETEEDLITDDENDSEFTDLTEEGSITDDENDSEFTDLTEEGSITDGVDPENENEELLKLARKSEFSINGVQIDDIIIKHPSLASRNLMEDVSHELARPYLLIKFLKHRRAKSIPNMFNCIVSGHPTFLKDEDEKVFPSPVIFHICQKDECFKSQKIDFMQNSILFHEKPNNLSYVDDFTTNRWKLHIVCGDKNHTASSKPLGWTLLINFFMPLKDSRVHPQIPLLSENRLKDMLKETSTRTYRYSEFSPPNGVREKTLIAVEVRDKNNPDAKRENSDFVPRYLRKGVFAWRGKYKYNSNVANGRDVFFNLYFSLKYIYHILPPSNSLDKSKSSS